MIKRLIYVMMIGLLGCNSDDEVKRDDGELSSSLIGRFNEEQVFDQGMAEIVAYHKNSQSALVVNANGNTVDIIDLSSLQSFALTNPLIDGNLAKRSQIKVEQQLPNAGGVNSVAVYDNLMVIAVANQQKQLPGYLVFYTINAQAEVTFNTIKPAGALPDNVVFSPDGKIVLAANEGEPSGDYQVDPEGSLTMVKIENSLPQTVVQIDFTDFNQGGSKASMIDDTVRVSHPAATVAQDLEPEYIAISEDSNKAYVALQENNAIAVLDIASQSVERIFSLGFKNHGIVENALDASNDDDKINIRPYANLYGVYMPDTIQSFSDQGVNYIITANEGDGREYSYSTDEMTCNNNGHSFDEGDCFSWVDETRVKKLQLDETVFTNEEIQSSSFLGNLKTLTDLGDTNEDGLYEKIYSFGARSFSIYNADTGEQVFDSGSDFETKTAEILAEAGFNTTNDENKFDNRSDDKGPEPEALAIGVIGDQRFAFIGLERTGGIMVYDITNPKEPIYSHYMINRDFTVDIESNFIAAGDLAPEGMAFIPAEDSVTENPMLIVGNEVSGSTTVYEFKLTYPN